MLGDIYLGLLAAIKARLLSIVSQFDVPGINTPVYVMILTLNYKHKILRYLPQCALVGTVFDSCSLPPVKQSSQILR